jgi:hypothetical protein
MKGRIACPKCKHEFVVDLPKDEKHKVVCPECSNEFIIKAKCKEGSKDKECLWEEHGEPRKTILSSIKPKTSFPMIAAVILIVVFSLGIATAVFSDVFIDSSLDLASDIGLRGSVKLIVFDDNNNELENVSITIANYVNTTDSQGIFYAENIDLGKQIIEIYYPGYIKQKREVLITPFLNHESTINLQSGSGSTETYKYNSFGCTIILIIFSLFALLAAINCFRKKYVDATLICSLIAILSLGFFLIGSILSIIAFVIIWKSRYEFENGKKGKTF